MVASFIGLLAAGLLSPAAPIPVQQGVSDTTRVVRGINNQLFAWGTLVKTNGERLQGYLPTAPAGQPGMVLYYALAPDSHPVRKPKILALSQVRWLRVQGQHLEVIQPDRRQPDSAVLAARRLTGALDLLHVPTAVAPLVSFLGPAPVLSSPAASTDALSQGPGRWYARRAGGAPVLLDPATFAAQVSALLADTPDLARRVAAAEEGYRFADVERVIQQYNQRARPR